MTEALDPANFNADSVKAVIEGSSLDAATKAQLGALVDGAAGNPALVEAALTQIRAALGL